jgi:hypothetical protein
MTKAPQRPARPPAWLRRGRLVDGGGLASTELVVITPVIFVMVLLPIHVALWWNAKKAVDLAVEEALEAAQIEGATAGDGVAGANAILGQTGHLEDVSVAVAINGDVVTVDITGRARYRVVPGGWYVSGHAEGRVERFVGEQER